jgi:hypothetical protein
LVLIGILGEVSATGLATGTALGAISAGMSARAILYEQMVDSVYENALKWIVQVRCVILCCTIFVNRKNKHPEFLQNEIFKHNLIFDLGIGNS